MKTPLLILAGLFAASAEAFGLDDITFWTGTGQNRAALVVDWNDPLAPPALAWGYRFDGTKTGEDMLAAVVKSDPLFYAKVSRFSFGVAVIGLGYDTDADGFALSDGTVFPPDGYRIGGTSDGATALDSGDRYGEGWNTGFWGYWQASGSTLGPWTESQVGLSDRLLIDGAWDGLSFAPGFVGGAPDEPEAAPEPATLAVLGLGLAALSRRRVR